MATINVEVSDKIAKKLSKYKVVSSDVLYKELDNEKWVSIKVGEKAEDVLSFLESIK
ncbi:MAG: hypothetical protein PHH06_01900 [Candidatus Gracilibacteria bacterium]|nr:hypothetical protein [Candidatus Gracilibacteria bacterium]